MILIFFINYPLGGSPLLNEIAGGGKKYFNNAAVRFHDLGILALVDRGRRLCKRTERREIKR